MFDLLHRMDPKQITIAITVYNRRQYVKQAIASALDQTVPVRVIVVEDCGPDPSLQAFVKSEFGTRIEYVRNPKRRGLFGNWNACLDLCQTEWITILHDDDFLAPEFIEAMVELEKESPGCALYFGTTLIVNEHGEAIPEQDSRTVSGRWMKRGLTDILYLPFCFAGHLFRVSDARAVGGFRETSFMCGDWEMWANLIALGGSAQSSRVVAFNRSHEGWDRGSNQVSRSGRHIPTTMVQHKRVLALLPVGSKIRFDRVAYHRENPLSTRFLLRYGASLSPRLLRHHVGLLCLSRAPNFGYALFQSLARLGGVPFVRTASKVWNCASKFRSHGRERC
jgi:glycosyltransferase involved in cell wall biosynthesis